jgi:adenylate cyclase
MKANANALDMGSEDKLNYTIMGNAVNLAGRLEGADKLYRIGGILISEYTKNAPALEFLCRSLDRVRVAGIGSPLRLYEITDFSGKASLA